MKTALTLKKLIVSEMEFIEPYPFHGVCSGCGKIKRFSYKLTMKDGGSVFWLCDDCCPEQIKPKEV